MEYGWGSHERLGVKNIIFYARIVNEMCLTRMEEYLHGHQSEQSPLVFMQKIMKVHTHFYNWS